MGSSKALIAGSNVVCLDAAEVELSSNPINGFYSCLISVSDVWILSGGAGGILNY